MKTEMKFKVAPTLLAPTTAISRVDPTLLTDCSKCEGNINIGLFFDGTGNNRDADKGAFKHSNVARLHETYLDKPTRGYFPLYIPGVGTRFPEIREAGESNLGSGFAIGCEQRVLYGLLHIFNSIHAGGFENQPMLSAAQVSALCCNGLVQWDEDSQDSVALGRLGLFRGLRMPYFGGDGKRLEILKGLEKQLQAALIKGRPIIKECFIDVFGFSRGAAEARVFCSWLDELLADGKLAGIIIHFRFVGLMDTVASAGFFSSVAAVVTGADGGHSGWADSRWLRIPTSVQNCVHMIAAHELRKNFPLDTITIGGDLPAHCQEYVYPGAHSDIGGGYAPGALGIAIDRDLHTADALKLSQLPLNHMLACAIAAGAPMKIATAVDRLRAYNPFALSPLVHKAYDDFVAFSTLKPRTVHEWLQPYLNWRWENRLAYRSLKHVREASQADRALLLAHNAWLVEDAAFLDYMERPRSFLSRLLPQSRILAQINAARLSAFDDEARSVLAIAKAAAPTEIRLHHMFDLFVHDSLAGFDHKRCELAGYWRYRKGYLGDEKRQITHSDVPGDVTSASVVGAA